ncbi:MAG: hypothetical protein FLDDKLPJ_01714 [Phycisphaerae bacterium]|nr:hypothetical protein [Phycisphaerae bacterium]
MPRRVCQSKRFLVDSRAVSKAKKKKAKNETEVVDDLEAPEAIPVAEDVPADLADADALPEADLTEAPEISDPVDAPEAPAGRPSGRRSIGAKEIIPFAWKLVGRSDGMTLTLFKAIEREEVEAQLERSVREGYYTDLKILPIAPPPPPPPIAPIAPPPTPEKPAAKGAPSPKAKVEVKTAIRPESKPAKSAAPSKKEGASGKRAKPATVKPGKSGVKKTPKKASARKK